MAATAKVLDFNQPESAARVGTEIETTALELVSRVKDAAAIVDLRGCEQAVADRRMIGDAVKRVEEFFAPFKDMAFKLHKALCQRENAILAPLKLVDGEKREAIRRYNDAQARIREARERELADQARRDADARAAAEAAVLETAGDSELAAAVLAEAIAAPAPVVVIPNELKGVIKTVRRYLWRYPGGTADAKTCDPRIVTRAMALVPREFLKVDEQKVGAYVRSMKDAAKIPGLQIYYVDDPVR